MSAAFTQWRSPASACRGALAWFLRDLRVGAGWGLFDDEGHPKAAFHALRRAWQPVHVGLVDEGQNGVFAHAVNEAPEPLDATLTLAFLQRGEVPVGRVERRIALAAHGAWREPVLAHAPGFLDLNGSYRFGPAAADTVVATLVDATGATRAETVLFLRAPGAAAPLVRSDIGLRAEARRTGDGQVRVTLRTRAAARGVHFEAPGWRCSDEYFALAPGAEAVVDFAPVSRAAAPAWYARANAINADAAAPIALVDLPS
jgi:beta-mannosidase